LRVSSCRFAVRIDSIQFGRHIKINIEVYLNFVSIYFQRDITTDATVFISLQNVMWKIADDAVALIIAAVIGATMDTMSPHHLGAKVRLLHLYAVFPVDLSSQTNLDFGAYSICRTEAGFGFGGFVHSAREPETHFSKTSKPAQEMVSLKIPEIRL